MQMSILHTVIWDMWQRKHWYLIVIIIWPRFMKWNTSGSSTLNTHSDFSRQSICPHEGYCGTGSSTWTHPACSFHRKADVYYCKMSPGCSQAASGPWHSRSLSVSVGIGLLYPQVDSMLGRPHKFRTEWASVMRCIAVFVGINHASAVSFLPLNNLRTVCWNMVKIFTLVNAVKRSIF